MDMRPCGVTQLLVEAGCGVKEDAAKRAGESEREIDAADCNNLRELAWYSSLDDALRVYSFLSVSKEMREYRIRSERAARCARGRESYALWIDATAAGKETWKRVASTRCNFLDHEDGEGSSDRLIGIRLKKMDSSANESMLHAEDIMHSASSSIHGKRSIDKSNSYHARCALPSVSLETGVCVYKSAECVKSRYVYSLRIIGVLHGNDKARGKQRDCAARIERAVIVDTAKSV
ncbi:hypothetical protein Tco_0127104 [Tanacetum coccineum]